MEHYTLSGSGGASLHGVVWRTEASPRAVIHFVHGVGEHIACYHEWAQGFCAVGFACTGIDQRGHGASSGKRGHTSTALIERDLETSLDHTLTIFPQIPLFLYGHSMGGAFALWYAVNHTLVPFFGVIASSPMLGLVHPPHAFWVRHSALLARMFPSLTLKTGIRKQDLSSDASAGKSTKTDPLMHKRISVLLFHDLLWVADALLKRDGPFPFPLLLMHGTSDPLCSVEATTRFSEHMGPETSLRLWNGWLHELHREPEALQMQEEVIAWIEKRLIYDPVI